MTLTAPALFIVSMISPAIPIPKSSIPSLLKPREATDLPKKSEYSLSFIDIAKDEVFANSLINSSTTVELSSGMCIFTKESIYEIL